MSEQTHRSDPRILNRRTLERDHRTVAKLLRPGMTVLDAGCGTGSITAGIARAVGPHGTVVGIDRNAEQIAEARQTHRALANLTFEEGDVLSMSFENHFDIVTAARVIQWIGRPGDAVLRMTRAAKPDGRVIVLDYNLADNSWEPEPPAPFRRFYQAFLDWRAANQWDNRMGDHLPEHFRAAGLSAVETHIDDEIARRGDPGFTDAASIWVNVVETMGKTIAIDGFLDESSRCAAESTYREFVESNLVEQKHSMRTVVGNR